MVVDASGWVNPALRRLQAPSAGRAAGGMWNEKTDGPETSKKYVRFASEVK